MNYEFSHIFVFVPVVPVILPADASYLSDSFHEMINHVTVHCHCHLIGDIFWQDNFTESIFYCWHNQNFYHSLSGIIIINHDYDHLNYHHGHQSSSS